jgi:hypothetical protein
LQSDGIGAAAPQPIGGACHTFLFLKVPSPSADSTGVRRKSASNEFCLYLWRSPETPGIRYMAGSADIAREVYSELLEEGYIVKAVHLGSGAEFEIRDGALQPVLG